MPKTKEEILREEVLIALLKYYNRGKGNIYLDEFVITKDIGRGWKLLSLVFKCPREKNNIRFEQKGQIV